MGMGSMTDIRRFVRCPECGELMTVIIDDKVKPDRWPLRVEGRHEDHTYIILFDSQFGITDVRKKPKQTREKR
jgi:hypothetical protein